MKQYLASNKPSGISEYEIFDTSIILLFVRGGKYRYSYEITGQSHVETMKSLAISGSGLCTYINTANPKLVFERM